MNQMGVPPGMAPGNMGPMANQMMNPPNTSSGMNPTQPPPGEMGGPMVTHPILLFCF